MVVEIVFDKFVLVRKLGQNIRYTRSEVKRFYKLP